MFVARAWRVRTRPIGTQCLCVVGIMVCGPISYSPRQTFRPYGTVADVERFSTNIPSLRDGSPGSTIVLQTCRPSGTVPTFYDCATNIPSLRDGPPMLNGFSTTIPSLWDDSPGSTIVLQTFRPA